MLIEHQSVDTRDYHWGKYDAGMAVYLYYAMMDGDDGDQNDSTEMGGWYCRYGRRVLFGNGRGFVYYHRFPTEAEAKAVCDATTEEWYNGEEAFDQ